MALYKDKQYKFALYLCKLLGMTDENFINDFLHYYAINFGYYRQFKSGTFWVTDSIKQLLIERHIRRNRFALNKREHPRYFRATDLANISFCPASFAISRTYKIDYPNMEKERQVGEKLHDKLNLIKRVSRYREKKEIEHKIFNQKEILEILNSKLIYSGHSQNKIHSFFDKINKIASEPDYIFQDLDSRFFVVEEKYHYRKDPKKKTFEDNYNEWHGIHDELHEEERSQEIQNWENLKPFFYLNHKIQLITYLKCVKEYSLEYGFLVYWYYDYDSEQNPYIHKVAVQKLRLDANTENLFNKTLTSLNTLVSTGSLPFNIAKLSPLKCSRCVVNKYCGHKTKRFKEIRFPYETEYLKLFPTVYEK